MKKALLSLLAVSMISIGHAQTNQEKDPEEFRVKKNELSVGMFNAFRLNSDPSPTITYKHYTKGGAFRVSIGGNYRLNDKTNSPQPIQNYEIIQDKFEQGSGNIGIGYEWHLPMNRWMLYYGLDARGFYNTSKDIFEDQRVRTDDIETNKNVVDQENIGFGTATFLGMKFWINERISLNTEFSALITYNLGTTKSSKTRIYDDQVVITTTENKSTSKTNNINANLSPLGLISFNFHF